MAAVLTDVTRPLFRLVSPTLLMTDVDLDLDTRFNTGLAGLEQALALEIHRIDLLLGVNGAIVQEVRLATINLVLTENAGARLANDEFASAQVLYTHQAQHHMQQAGTSGNITVNETRMTQHSYDFVQPQLTIASRLNFLAQATENVAATFPDTLTQLIIWMKIVPISTSTRADLLARLTLATQP